MSLRAFVVVTFVWSLVSIALKPSPFTAAGLVLTLVVSYFLLRGVRWLWLFLVVGGLLAQAIPPYKPWYLILLAVASLALLVLPDSRRHFARPG